MSKNIVEIKNLEFGYKKEINLAIDNLSFPDGKISTILGPSGSGKTTLLNLIAGFLKTKKGEIAINTDNGDFAFIFQNNLLYDDLSLWKNVWLVAKNSPDFWFDLAYKNLQFLADEKLISETDFAKIKTEINAIKKSHKYYWVTKFKMKLLHSKIALSTKEKWKTFLTFNINKHLKDELKIILEKLNLSGYEKQKIQNLSGGQKQRVSLARALIKNTKLFLLDEPFAAFDAKLKEEALIWLSQVQKEFNLTLIMVTHDQKDALKISDQITLINHGLIQQSSSAKELYEQPENKFVATFIGYPEINLIHKDEEYEFYLRPNFINIEDDQNGQYEIKEKYFLGENIFYELKKIDKDFELRVISNNFNFELNQKVNVVFDKSKIIKLLINKGKNA